MRKTRSTSMVYGATVLAAANIICKFLGFLFKVPLANLIGREGMGYFGFAYQIFGVVTVIAVSGLPVALATMVASGDRARSGGMLKTAVGLFATAGIGGALVLFFLADPLCALSNSAPAAHSVRAMAPSAFFVSLCAAFRGYFQGRGDMTPNAVSQVAEALVKLGLGVGLAYALHRGGKAPEIVASGAVLGVTAGTAVAALLLSLFAWRSIRGTKSIPGLKKALLKTAMPITLGAMFLSLCNAIDAVLVMKRLGAAGYGVKEATELYGAYTGYAVTMFSLPSAITSAVAASLVAVVASAHGRGAEGLARIRRHTETALRLTLTVVMLCAAGFALMPHRLLSLLFSRAADVAVAAPLLQELFAATVFIALITVSTAVLQAVGRPTVPVTAMAVGGVVKLLLNYVLIAIPGINIHGAPIASTASYAVTAVINLAVLSGLIGGVPGLARNMLKTAACGTLSIVTARGVSAAFAGLGARLSTLAGLAVASSVFVFMVYGTKTVGREDLGFFIKKKNTGGKTQNV